ncbi:hypothetical protein H9Q72_014214 [Fusarium xylarioides]|uniref:CCHC-type domain-containing protein n=1 Tax=Fusarium xylarioides TaxID=221167 RepID=A0A9P7HK58_9HYPO|nr:hypothetical protein H9Q72_014214 [Fusarium xylarioides]
MSLSKVQSTSDIPSSSMTAENLNSLLELVKKQSKEVETLSITVREMNYTFLRINALQNAPLKQNRVKFLLENDADKLLVKNMGINGILQKLAKAGPPFNEVIAVDLGPGNALYIFFLLKSDEGEMAFREKGHEVSKILGVSLYSRIIPFQFLLEVCNMSTHKLKKDGVMENFSDPHRLLAPWSAQNDVRFYEARFRRGRLVLGLQDRQQALKLADTGVVLGARFSRVIPRDIESFAKQCFNCQETTHLLRECRNKPRCGWCAEEHATKDCPSNTSEKHENLTCANCKEHDHPAWSRRCTAETVMKMRADCRVVMRRGPRWAPKVAPLFGPLPFQHQPQKESNEQDIDMVDGGESSKKCSERGNRTSNKKRKGLSAASASKSSLPKLGSATARRSYDVSFTDTAMETGSDGESGSASVGEIRYLLNPTSE